MTTESDITTHRAAGVARVDAYANRYGRHRERHSLCTRTARGGVASRAPPAMILQKVCRYGLQNDQRRGGFAGPTRYVHERAQQDWLASRAPPVRT